MGTEAEVREGVGHLYIGIRRVCIYAIE